MFSRRSFFLFLFISFHNRYGHGASWPVWAQAPRGARLTRCASLCFARNVGAVPEAGDLCALCSVVQRSAARKGEGAMENAPARL